MQSKLDRAVDASMPRFNPIIAEGFHQKEFEQGITYFKNALRLIFKPIEKRGVFFRDVKEMTPKQFIDHIKDSANRMYDVHKESYYPVMLEFEFLDKSGEMLKFKPTVTMLPYTDVYGDVFIRDTQYSAQIVLAERGLPVTKENEIFAKVLGFKFKIGVESYTYSLVIPTDEGYKLRNGDINMSANRFYSPTEPRKITDKKTPIPLLAWYVFANIGFTETIKRYGECEYEIGSLDALVAECRPEDRWQIITRAPSGSNEKRLGEFVASDWAIAVRNIHASRTELSSMGLQYANALLFVMDCMSSYFDVDQIDNPSYWKILIGRCSVKPGDSNEVIMRLMNDHFIAVNEYLDEDSIKRFRNQSINVDDMFDLFTYIIANRGEIVATADRGNMFDKELASLEFIMDGLITAASNFKHDVKNNSELSFKKVARFLSTRFRIKELDNARNANLIQEATPTDNPYIDYMLGCMPQHKVYSNSSSAKKSADFDPNDPAGLLHPSLLFVNGVSRVTGPYPDGRGYLLPCLYLINGRTTALDPQFRALYAKVDHRLRHREITVKNEGVIRPKK
jgi:hypothetical protein